MNEPRSNRGRALATITLLLSGMMVFSIHMPETGSATRQSRTEQATNHLKATVDAPAGGISALSDGDTSGSFDSGAPAGAGGDTPDSSEVDAPASPVAAHTLRPPAILRPVANTAIDIGDRTLSWDASPDADRYRVILTDTVRWRRVYDRSDIRRTHVTLPPGILHVGGTFQLSVQALSGAETSEPVRIDFTVRALPLPNIISPQKDASLALEDVPFAWEPVPGITDYHVVVKDTVTWNTVADHAIHQDTRCLLDASRFAIGGQYRLYVHPTLHGEDGAPAYVDIHTQRLSSPRLLAPGSGEAVGLTDLSVSWEPVLMATSYHLALTIPESGEVVFETRDVKNPDLTLAARLFRPGITYRVFVFACSGENESAPTYGDFTVKPLDVPVLTAPVSGASLPAADLYVTWNPVAGADHYKLVMTDTITWQTVLTDDAIEGNTYQVDAALLSRSGQYRIYVHAIQNGMESAPGMVDVTTTPLPAPRLVLPHNATELPPGEVEVDWEPVAGAEQYRVTLTDTVTWEIRSSQAGITDTSHRFDASLFNPGGTYRIYVSALAGTGESIPAIVDIRIGR